MHWKIITGNKISFKLNGNSKCLNTIIYGINIKSKFKCQWKGLKIDRNLRTLSKIVNTRCWEKTNYWRN